jgi:hypothetical protein
MRLRFRAASGVVDSFDYTAIGYNAFIASTAADYQVVRARVAHVRPGAEPKFLS